MQRKMMSFASVCLIAIASAADAQDVGPRNGSLVVVGGGLQDSAIVRRFLDLAGGTTASIVVIPTAGEQPTYAQNWEGLQQFRDGGARNLRVLHTRKREEADTEAFADPIRHADGVWFPGGRQWRLADAYLNTKVHEALTALLARGGVIGGTSAGATILGSFLVRGDTKGNEVMIGDHLEGFGFLKQVAVDQHLLRRNRQFDLLTVIDQYPELLGIGIDEDTAIVVKGDRFEVMGQGYVAIYDRERQLDSGGRFYLLAPGDTFNMKTREAFRPTTDQEPLQRVIKKPWPSGR